MKLVVGLGNPEKKYEKTRHNIGFWAIDQLVDQILGNNGVFQESDNRFTYDKKFLSKTVKIGEVIFGKPQTYMNSSGKSVQKLVKYYKVKSEDLWVIYDDLDIKLGHYKIQSSKGPKVHNGLNSIYSQTGYKDFWHVRVGIENRERKKSNGKKTISGEKYVLSEFDEKEIELVKNTLSRVVEDLLERVLD